MSHISHIVIDDSNLPPPTPEIEQERKVAMFDLLEENSFSLPARDDRVVPDGPYHLNLSIRDKRLVFDIETTDAAAVAQQQKTDVEIPRLGIRHLMTWTAVTAVAITAYRDRKSVV